jgi:hypothetical protein
VRTLGGRTVRSRGRIGTFLRDGAELFVKLLTASMAGGDLHVVVVVTLAFVTRVIVVYHWATRGGERSAN